MTPRTTTRTGERRVFVTPHAAAAFRERCGAALKTGRTAEQTIAAGIERAIFTVEITGGTLWGCQSENGVLFLALSDRADARAPFVLVRSVGAWWFWHEARPQWRAAGLLVRQGSRRKQNGEKARANYVAIR